MVPTPGELNKIRSAVAQAAADLLAREDNGERSAETLAEELAEAMIETMVSAYEEIQAKAYNLVVLGHFRLDDDSSYVAAVGPLSTRATQRARGVGEHFAWDYKTRTGTGRFVLVPLVRSPREAWDAARQDMAAEFVAHLSTPVPGVEPSYEPMRFDMPEHVRASISSEWEIDAETLAQKFGPACLCGLDLSHLKAQGKYALCPRHPAEGEPNGEG